VQRAPFDAHSLFVPADRRTRLNAAQPGAKFFLRATIDRAPNGPRTRSTKVAAVIFPRRAADSAG
jgi:hypothetical protein